MLGTFVAGSYVLGTVPSQEGIGTITESNSESEALQILFERNQNTTALAGSGLMGSAVLGCCRAVSEISEGYIGEKNPEAETLEFDVSLPSMDETETDTEALTFGVGYPITDAEPEAETLEVLEGAWLGETETDTETLEFTLSRFRPSEREINRLALIWLVDIQLKNSGPLLHLSDRNVTADDGTGYEAYLENLSGIADEIKRASAEGRNADVSLVFRNMPYSSYDFLIEIGETYPFEGAEITIKECYLFDDNSILNVATLFKGVLDEPRGIDDLGFTCNCSSKEFYADKTWKQEIIDTVKYPNAYEDVGKYEPIVYGADVRIPCPRTDWGAKTTLKTSINSSQGSLELSDGSRFPSSGYLWIDEEAVFFVRSGNTCSLNRHQLGTEAKSHRAGAEVWEHKSLYKSLLARHLLYDIGDIYAEIAGKLLRVTSGVSAVVDGGKTYLHATEQIRVKEVEDEIDVADTIAVNDAIAVADNISITGAATTRKVYPTGGPAAALDGNEYTNYYETSSSPISFNFFFPSDNFGQIIRQYLWVKFHSWPSVTVGGSGGGWTPTPMPSPGAASWVRLQKTGGNWGDSAQFSLWPELGTCWISIYEVYKEVEYYPTTTKSGSAYRSGAATKTGIAQKTGEVVVSTKSVDRFHVVCSGHKDETGDYGGIGTLIERPDWVQKHFIKNYMGFALSEFDGNNWNAAGDWYQTNAYKFGFAILDKITPSELRRRMDFESRTNGFYKGGKWYLKVIPDTAPSAVKTIPKADLAGQYAKFIFDKMPWINLANDLTLKYKRNYSQVSTESEWDGTLTASDATSQAKYGTYPKEFQFELLRDTATATSVLAHILLERKTALLTVRFPVFWKDFDLKVGDTFDITNDFYNAKKFYIENMRRIDKARMEIRAVEWW